MNDRTYPQEALKIQSLVKVSLLFALFWCVGAYVNLPVRILLKGLFQSVPYWIDHIFFMLLAKTLVAVLVGSLLLKKEEAFIFWRPKRKYIFEATISGLLIVVLIALCLKLDGFLKFQFRPIFPVMFGNIFSNFYEELIYRGVIFGLFQKYLKNKLALSAILSSVIFVQGHMHYPFFLLSAIFFSGLYWCYLTQRSKSLLPAWISHCLMDFIADTIFAT